VDGNGEQPEATTQERDPYLSPVKKCQLTYVLKDGTTVQLMIGLPANACHAKIREARGQSQEVDRVAELPSVIKDDKVESDTLFLLTDNIAFYSIIQPKPESLIVTPRTGLVKA
jgi:hypothetical protein